MEFPKLITRKNTYRMLIGLMVLAGIFDKLALALALFGWAMLTGWPPEFGEEK